MFSQKLQTPADVCWFGAIQAFVPLFFAWVLKATVGLLSWCFAEQTLWSFDKIYFYIYISRAINSIKSWRTGWVGAGIEWNEKLITCSGTICGFASCAAVNWPGFGANHQSFGFPFLMRGCLLGSFPPRLPPAWSSSRDQQECWGSVSCNSVSAMIIWQSAALCKCHSCLPAGSTWLDSSTFYTLLYYFFFLTKHSNTQKPPFILYYFSSSPHS